MPLSAFPGGVSSFGIPLIGQGSPYDMPCGNVWFVCNRTGVINGDGTTRAGPFASIADALARVPSSNGTQSDVIYVLAGHAENVTASNVFSGTAAGGPNTGAQVIQRGVRIIGEGVETSRPTFTFTAAASTLAFANADSSIENCILLCPQTGTTTTAAILTVTAAGVRVRSCQFGMSSSATALATTGISLSVAANDFLVLDCQGFTVTGAPTSWLSTTGTAAPGRVKILYNRGVRCILSSATGGIVDWSANTGTVGLNWEIFGNAFANLAAASTVVIKGGTGLTTGHIEYNDLETLAASAATAITIAAGVSMSMYQNFIAQPGKFAISSTSGGTSA